MTYEEFRAKVSDELVNYYLKAFPKEEVIKFVEDSEADIKEAYDECVQGKVKAHGDVFEAQIGSLVYGMSYLF